MDIYLFQVITSLIAAVIILILLVKRRHVNAKTQRSREDCIGVFGGCPHAGSWRGVCFVEQRSYLDIEQFSTMFGSEAVNFINVRADAAMLN